MKLDDMRSFMAVVLTLAFIVGALVGDAVLPDRFLVLKDLALVVVSYYFGTKTALDKPGS